MTTNPPDRARLAASLKALVRNPSYTTWVRERSTLVQYVDIAEDTIEAQAAMLRADLTAAEIERLRTELARAQTGNAELHAVALAALSAAGVCGPDAAEAIRRALEKTT